MAKSRDRGRGDGLTEARLQQTVRRLRNPRRSPRSLAEVTAAAVSRSLPCATKSVECTPAIEEFGQAIAEALEQRLGSERFAVWFGDSLAIEVQSPAASSARWAVRLFHDPGFTGEWLRKTFSRDVREVAESVCGGGVEIHWQPLPDGSPQPVETPASGPSLPQGGQERQRVTTAARRPRPAAAMETHGPGRFYRSYRSGCWRRP